MKRIVTLSVVLGLIMSYISVYAAPRHDRYDFTTGCDASAYPTCAVYNAKISVIDPCCCKTVSPGHCQDYKVERWSCAAGNIKYKNFGTSGPVSAGSDCQSGPTPGCN